MSSSPSPAVANPPAGATAEGGTASPAAAAGGASSGSGSSPTMNWEPVRKRLLGPDLHDAHLAATELREGIEIVHTTEFPLMLSALLPAFSSILAHKTRPSADTTSIEHKLRNVVLEIISRMPSNEVLRPHAPHLVALAIDILNRDYEDNALLASRLIFDLYKVYRSLPQDYVQPYLDFVQASYRALPAAVSRNFALPAVPPTPNTTTTTAEGATAATTTPNTTIATSPGPAPALEASDAKAAATATTTEATTPPAPATATTTPPSAKTPPAAPTAVQSPSSAASVGSLTSSSPKPRLAQRANASFRVLTECPLIVMLMFQLYPKFLKSNIPVLINVMMEALSLRAPPIQSLVPPNTKLDSNNKRHYFSRTRELVAAQAKTLSFLTYLLRGFSNDLKPYEDRLASNVVALMSTCPRESISTRKELLVATRHLLNSDFRTGFFRHVDALLDDRVLMGANHRYSEQTVLRPLGYTALSDLIHHVKTLLTMSQMSRVVCMFSRILHDSSTTLPMSTQYTAVRTLLSVVDIIFHNKDPNPQIGRDMLVRILSTLVNKLSTLKEYFPVVKKADVGNKPACDDCHQTMDHLALSSFTSRGHLGGGEDHHHVFLPSDRGDHSRERNVSFDGNIDVSDSVQDLKSMVRAIVVGHKTVIWYINNYRSQREKVDKNSSKSMPAPGSNEEVSSAMLKMTNSERALVDQYILLAIPCVQFLKEESTATSTSGDSVTTASPEKLPLSDQYRDVLSYFAAAFTTLDGYDLKRTLGRRLDVLVDAIVDDPTIMVIPRHLLGSNSTTSYEFCIILLNFLVERMDALFMSCPDDVHFFGPPMGGSLREVETVTPPVQDTIQASGESTELVEKRAATYLQLFERVLKSLSVYPDNEKALRPHLRRIVSKCLRSSMENTEKWPDNFCMLLRYVFRSISAGKFEESYKELLPLIPTALNGLYRVITATNSSLVRNTLIELSLTIPARLSSLLPHMNLLLRVIVQALTSESGDLVNLGLRTLEFWVDNLNPDFLYPELSKQTLLFTELMHALSRHLQPAPYPYGLLTLRLLGKLGGKNRRFLREPVDVCEENEIGNGGHSIGIKCGWLPPETLGDGEKTQATENSSGILTLPLPIERCVEVLKLLASLEDSGVNDVGTQEKTGTIANQKDEKVSFLWKESSRLWAIEIEDVDFASYRSNVKSETKSSQAMAAFCVIRAALSACLAPTTMKAPTYEVTDAPVEDSDEKKESDEDHPDVVGLCYATEEIRYKNADFLNIGLGLMYGCLVEATKSEAMVLVKGLGVSIFFSVLSHHKCFRRIDANGSPIEDDLAGENVKEETPKPSDEDEGLPVTSEQLGSLKPFGYFHLIGTLEGRADPLVFNRAIAEFLSVASPQATEVGLEILRDLLKYAKRSVSDGAPADEEKPEVLHRGAEIYFENLLSHLCMNSFSKEWNRRDGLQEGICLLLKGLGSDWGLKYEDEIMNVAFFAVKSVPRELSTAVVKSFRFFVRVCCALYGRPTALDGDDVDALVWDALAVTGEKSTRKDSPDAPESDSKQPSTMVRSPSTAILQVLFIEMASTKQIVRVAARFLLKHFVATKSSEESEKMFKSQLSSIRRVIFSRSLRLLPLAEQVGAVEALTFIVKEAKNILTLADQHLLAFLSELLKMSSVADGEMSDTALAGYVVDKNGNATSSSKQSPADTPKTGAYPSHASALFFRRECILHIDGTKFVVPEELPHGVQLRVSSISLLHSVISCHPDAFFDAEVSTPIGNIRPHVISLLFRSLVSNPLKAVITAHEALREVLTLSVAAREGTEKSKSQSRLPKELLQTCIRPVLLNLREYTRLSVPLLRGLSRLLSLLSSWFNKTLGEKLLDHLQKWTDPTLIKSHKIWRVGEEPKVAAAIIDLFSLLPHASHFVEPLVKTTIKLEAYLPGFNAHCVDSPYRKPLARYLNKHCQYTVGFFFQRLKAPIYSELFQYIVRLDECSALRTYLSGTQCSVMMLNVCFERPLAIIRSEKTSPSTPSGASAPTKSPPSKTTSEIFHLHGVQVEASQKNQRESVLKQDVDVKKKKLQILQQEMTKAKEVAEQKGEEAQKQYRQTKAAFDKSTKELNEAKQRYAAEVATSGSRPQDLGSTTSSTGNNTSPRPMNTESLELQHQGFMLVEALISKNDKYLQEHNDVVRAFRWLWRSKGRYLRLQHEYSVSPRFHGESKILVTFLMNYAKSFPNDVDVLFELIRIFLQPATTDFSFVRRFLAETVGCNLEMPQKKQIIQRFFALLAGESTEETKALSIQLLLYPLLSAAFTSEPKKDATREDEDGDKKDSSAEGDQDKMDLSSDKEGGVLVDKAMIQKLVTEVLFDKGHPISCGDKFKVELLRVVNLILEHAPEAVHEYQKEIIRFCWNLIKSEDALCKSWAYVVLCRLISLFETQGKYVLQVYAALLRSHQQEGKYLVRAALSMLVPALQERLSAIDFKKVIDTTSRIMFEDGSVPQLAHIWQTIVTNPEVYYPHRHNFVRYMVNSLNRLGLPPNSPPENRALAVSSIGLLIEWDERRRSEQESEKAQSNDESPSKRKSPPDDTTSPTKKMKDTTGTAVATAMANEESVLLDKSMMETVVNFLVRLKVLLADPKVDAGALNMDARIMKNFRNVMGTWGNSVIRPIYFEKVVSLCKEEGALAAADSEGPGRATKASKTARGNSPKDHASPTNSGKKSESNLVTAGMLSACLDIFIALNEEAPENNFLADNPSQVKAILGACFRHVGKKEGLSIRPKLRSFIVGLQKAALDRPQVYEDVLQSTNAALEKLIADTGAKLSHSSSLEQRRESAASRGRDREPAEDKDGDSFVLQFALEVIEEVCTHRRDYFATFSGSLIALANNLVKKHLADTSAKQRHGISHSPQAGTYGIPQMYPTPVIGILDECYTGEATQKTATGLAKAVSMKKASQYTDSIALGTPLRCLITVLRLMGKSDLPYVFTEERKAFFQIVSSILDNSDNVQLLITTIKVLGEWLVANESGGPLTVKERNSFLWKLAAFDFFNGASDLDSQPLADLVAHYVVSFVHGKKAVENLLGKSSPENSDLVEDIAGPTSSRISDSDDMIMSRSLVACLLNASSNIRSEVLSLLANRESDSISEPGSVSGHNQDFILGPKTALSALWQLLHNDYEGLGGRCWVVIFVEIFLGCMSSDGGVSLSSRRLQGLSEGADNMAEPWLPNPLWTNSTRDSDSNDESYDVYTEFCRIMEKQRQPAENGLSECLLALRTLAHGDIGICRSLFDAILPAAWNQIPSDGVRLRLVPALESLLARPFHSQFLKQSKASANKGATTNAIRFFLNTLLLLRPLPLLDTSLLVSLAENYNCWYEVLTLLEQQHAALTENDARKDRQELCDITLSAMRQIYRKLGDTDLWMSLASESCVVEESQWAMALDIYGMVNDASEAYSQLVERYQADDATLERASDFELGMWEERWVELQRELCQYDVVSEFASMSGNTSLLLESAWKSQDWEKVRQLVVSPQLIAAVESGDPTVKICETLLAVADGKLNDVENSHAQAAQLCLYKWQQLPKIAHGSYSHESLLHFFHRLVEIRESGQIMVETSQHATGRTLPDLKNLLNAWRHRLPNDYEKLTVWDEVFQWRSHMFSAITKNFSWSEPNTLATLHDKPWTSIRIAKTARKQGTRETSLILLNKVESRSMDVTDAFLKLREQILIYDKPDSDLERTGGLNLINTTNLSFFDAPQKSELFRLKAQFLASLGLRSKSNQAYCHSVQICPSHARAWVSWGGLCSNLGALTEKQMEQAAVKSGAEASKETRANTGRKVAQYLAQSMGCYFEAIQLETHEWARIHLPKCLLMLVKDGSTPGVLCQTLENRGSALPPWVWLPWIPQLLSCLCRNEGRAVKAILSKLVKAYPQAVYYGLRAFYLERRDVERTKVQGTSSSSSTHMGSVAHAEEMMSTLRRSHASLWSSLESILEELIVKFRPSYEEELLATITALIERADSQPGSSDQAANKGEDMNTMVASVSKTLGRIATKFFKTTSELNPRNDERARKTSEFKMKYKTQFETDFKVSSSEKEQVDQVPQFSLPEYLVLLKRWRRKLEMQVASTPLELPLIETSHSLSLFSAEAPDLWPGSCDPRYVGSSRPEQSFGIFETDTRTIQSSTSSSAAAARKAASAAATAAASAAAKEGVGGEYGGGSACIEIPGQYVPNTCSSSDLKPSPELHAKLVRLEPTVEVLRREQLVRRISMVGSDGRVYRFLLQFAIPYWTRTDERVAQTHYVLDKILKKRGMSSRQHISVQPTSVIPVAQRLRMTGDSSSRTSLDEIHKHHCKLQGQNANRIANLYNEELAKIPSSKPDMDKETETEKRAEVFRNICKKADSTVLLRHMNNALGDPEPLFQFRRAFTEHLALNSLMQYAFSVAERTPARMVFVQSSGRVQSPDFRVSYSSQGFIESRTMPFRLTPNLTTFIGKPLLHGRFATTFSTVAESIKDCKEYDPILRLLMRDDIVAWYCKSMAKSDSKLQELEKQLVDRVSKNVSHLQGRFSECAPKKEKESEKVKDGPVDKKVRELISAATDSEKLCMMATSYQAWL